MINVMYTMIGQPLKTWVSQQIEIRNEKMVQNNFVEMEPAIAEAFRASSHISCKWKSFLMLTQSVFTF